MLVLEDAHDTLADIVSLPDPREAIA